jgi:hypothetical protein
LAEPRRLHALARWDHFRARLLRGRACRSGGPEDGADNGHAERDAAGLAGRRPGHEQLADGGDEQAERANHEEQDADGLHVFFLAR